MDPASWGQYKNTSEFMKLSLAVAFYKENNINETFWPSIVTSPFTLYFRVFSWKRIYQNIIFKIFFFKQNYERLWSSEYRYWRASISIKAEMMSDHDSLGFVIGRCQDQQRESRDNVKACEIKKINQNYFKYYYIWVNIKHL